MKKIFIQPSAAIICAEAQSIIAASQIEGAGSNKNQGVIPEARQNNVLTDGTQGSDISALQLN